MYSKKNNTNVTKIIKNNTRVTFNPYSLSLGKEIFLNSESDDLTNGQITNPNPKIATPSKIPANTLYIFHQLP